MPGHGSSETPKENAPLHSTRTETELEPVQVRSEAKAKQSLSKERASNQPLVQTANVPVSQKEVTIVIPTLNESGAIGKVLEDLKREGYDNLLVVDGYSTDGSREIAEASGATVVLQHGPGKAGALRTAIELVATEYMAVMDGDSTYSASDIKRLLVYGGRYDEVIGARTTGRENVPRMNRLGNWVISKTFKLLFDRPITDVLSGMYLLRTETVRDLRVTSTSFDIEVEIASHVATEGDITQVPITYGRRIGKQKLSRSHGARILGTLFWMAYYNNPVLLLGFFASLFAIPAAAIIAWTIYQELVFRVWHYALALFAVMLLLLSTQAAAVSLMSLMSKRSEQRVLLEIRKSKR